MCAIHMCAIHMCSQRERQCAIHMRSRRERRCSRRPQRPAASAPHTCTRANRGGGSAPYTFVNEGNCGVTRPQRPLLQRALLQRALLLPPHSRRAHQIVSFYWLSVQSHRVTRSSLASPLTLTFMNRSQSSAHTRVPPRPVNRVPLTLQ